MVLVEMMKYIPDNYQLILAGNTEGTYSEQIQERIFQLGLENRIMMPGKITDDDKYWLLSHCTALCFPSKLEGMGIPPIEAMRFGKPVFASTFSSIQKSAKNMLIIGRILNLVIWLTFSKAPRRISHESRKRTSVNCVF